MIDEKKLIDRLQIAIKYSDNSNFTNGLLSAIDIVNQQPKIGEWIPCSEMLPDKNGIYLVTQITHSISTGNPIKTTTEYVEFLEGKWRRNKYLEVIAWQPLPEQYKEGKS